ncbi:hypothetical protein JAAARDRAFT_40380 [Jaapia argillacea MUCL 33604]|uniref:Protein kinase domain-containing protein n=1 Tax=Jaapia argillacea MUCL 33604 TaxID=933084 RepID=A0A067PPL0_9AGAM|nr:hypothetical protein JAAARDRAFT_40380 [Jaapia argillacea MUCL 33604]
MAGEGQVDLTFEGEDAARSIASAVQNSSLVELRSALRSELIRVRNLTAFITKRDEFPVATGGFADVFKAEMEGDEDENGWVVLPETVGIKVLRIDKCPDPVRAKRRWDRELEVWHRLHHPNVVELLGIYHKEGRSGMVTHWHKNGNAREYLEKQPFVNRVQLIMDVASGLAYLHQFHPVIVHGDLKADNVLIDNHGRALLTDFGLSQFIGDMAERTIPATSKFAGARRWLSPEIAVELIDDSYISPPLPVRTCASDVWAFGCTAYELMTSMVPYRHRDRDWHVLFDIANGVKPGRRQEPSMPGSTDQLWELMDLCWVHQPERRPSMNILVPRISRLSLPGWIQVHHVRRGTLPTQALETQVL